MSDGLTSIDLFAGCGGLSLGLHRAGWTGIFAIERDPMAFDTLRSNLVDDDAPYRAYVDWPEWVDKTPHDIDTFVGDPQIVEHLRALRGSVTLVAGGPPCQGFSVGGARDGADERNHLVHRLLEVVDAVRPKIALIENVEGITRPFRSRPREGATSSVAEDVVVAFESLGYTAAFGIANASHFGVPQTRRRAVIIGVRDDLGVEPSDFFRHLEKIQDQHLIANKLPTDRPVTAAEALGDLHSGQERIPSPDSPKFETSAYVDAKSEFAKALRRGIPTGGLPDSHRYTKHGERILELYERAHGTQPKGRLSKDFLLSMGTKKDKKVLIDPDAPVSTITTHPDEFIHYAEPRNITVREMARLQSFPDDFQFKGRYTINGPRRKFDVARCSQVGNAVPPLFAEAIGRALKEMLSD
ncbi:DNA cytosine methyltransferase [Zhihengliuella halotolerans]|uniref:DNA (cytosine-5-)-methyltransferase n=1 Tax=Zhihengliuella halotolerans TaxID=370736 RepID=A0A4Q8AEZ2_9MICC|nr:DNA cytosine methyltransferase [Zhihengliuella halotolerans]RZU62233.1 DNA (cytosine-5)-methyltransferase 1 [Zhihengliuella halotolerans]